MKIAYKSQAFKDNSLLIIARANDIVAEYSAQGYDLTLRQLYYQFVSRDWLPNRQTAYNQLGSVINDARLAGLVDWSAIVDRTRNLKSNSHWGEPEDIIDSAARSFAIDKWADQPTRVEVWVEKEALAGIVGQVAERHDVAYFACKGYVSQSELWAAAQRHLEYIRNGQNVVVVHLGDHDPSGIDMTRDIRDRLNLFLDRDWLNDNADDFSDGQVRVRDIREHMRHHLGDINPDAIGVNRVALNMDQVQEYDPPPNPAKLTDSRANDYIENYGDESWELDALDPSQLDAVIEEAILAELDEDTFEAKVEEEEEHRKVLTAISRRWDEVVELMNGEAS